MTQENINVKQRKVEVLQQKENPTNNSRFNQLWNLTSQ
jgi:hypothetical protein